MQVWVVTGASVDMGAGAGASVGMGMGMGVCKEEVGSEEWGTNVRLRGDEIKIGRRMSS